MPCPTRTPGLKRIGTGREGLGADDGIRTSDPHLGNGMADVSCVSTGLTSAPELRVLGALVSSVSPDCWSRLNFVGDFVGAFPPRPTYPPEGGRPPNATVPGARRARRGKPRSFPFRGTSPPR